MAGATRIPLGKLAPTIGRWSAWADGVVSIGSFTPNSVEFDLTTDGLAGGIDRRFSDKFSLGLGGDLMLGEGRFTFDYSALTDTDRATDHRLSVGGAMKF